MSAPTGDGAPNDDPQPSTSKCDPTTKVKSPDTRSPRLLPPIHGETPSTSGQNTLAVSKSSKGGKKQQSKSQYHSGCRQKHSIYMDWTANKAQKNGAVYLPWRSNKKSMAAFKDNEERAVAAYLDTHMYFLSTYVFERIHVELLDKWVRLKNKNRYTAYKNEKKSYRNRVDYCSKEMIKELLHAIEADPEEHSVVMELSSYLACSLGTSAFRLFKVEHSQHSNDVHILKRHIKTGKVVRESFLPSNDAVYQVLTTAATGKVRCLNKTDHPARFPVPPVNLGRTQEYADNVLYQPIAVKGGNIGYVVEIWRLKQRFNAVDEEISLNFLVLASMTLHYCNLYQEKTRERNMSDFLLDVVKAIFEKMVSLDELIKRILEFAQRLVNADRASLFLVDGRNSELVSTVFDLKFEPGQDRDMEKKEIRMPINKGIAGSVAVSGATLNIPDAYADERFNREVDEATGYKTKSILCMPIKVEGKVIGVVQMVNKRTANTFDHEDEVHFKIFSTFFGLALHHARLYDRIMRKEQKYRVALEVLSYHNTCRENEVREMLQDTEPVRVNLNDYYLDPYKYNEIEKCKCIIKMFRNLFPGESFDVHTLTRFVLTVKKNYRTVPYHNFDHGWSVAHAMYVILKNDKRRRFNSIMRLALFVACLCHDLDHRGYTNKYMSEIASPLAAMYTTSTLEHHHFNITVTILQQEGHNIFSNMSSLDYKYILGYIRHCILATDLATFFPNLAKITELHEGSTVQFNWKIPSHTELAMAISMTAADLSASAKPWDIQIKTVRVIFEEFYDQGDKERAAGREPIPMMDRNKPDQKPSSQVGFLSQICIPCYGMLNRILPTTRPMYAMALRNLERWQVKSDRIELKLTHPDIQIEASADEDFDSPALITDEPQEEQALKLKISEDPALVEDVVHEAVSWEEDTEGIGGERFSPLYPWSDMPGGGIWQDFEFDAECDK